MPKVDDLNIEISAKAESAIDSIDRLLGKLSTLSMTLASINGNGLKNLSEGVERLSEAMQKMNAVKTTDFTRLAKNIQKLGDLDPSKLTAVATSINKMSHILSGTDVTTAADNMAKLSDAIAKLGYKRVEKAITNIPKLATAVKKLMNALRNTPKISQNIIDMTNALANLVNQGSKVGTVANSMVNGVKGYSRSVRVGSKSTWSISSAIGKFYATCFLAIRGVKALGNSIQDSMEYIETLNYFEKAFQQVADSADISAWEDLGYESAQAYYDSFETQAKKLTEKMSGFKIEDDGTLSETGKASLGISPSTLMNYQAMFAQMSSSMGMTAENATNVSEALTRIGADLASVKNMDFEDVWENLASGLGGASRALDKYGVNIRNVNLQQKLNELGIEANIQALNQNDKALLRTIILLDTTRYAWADLAETLNQPANQLRLLENNLQNLSRTIGNLFMPLVQNVLPYINGLVIAIQRLFTWFGKLIGINLNEVTDSVGEGGNAVAELLGETEDAAEGLEDAAASAKKLNNQLQGFDELNIVSPVVEDNASGSAAGFDSGLLDQAFNDAFEEYTKVWDDAFASVENTAQRIADNIENAFTPLKNIIEDFAVGDFFKAGQDTSGLVISIFDFMTRALEQVDWYSIGEKFGSFLAGIDWKGMLSSIGKFIWEAITDAIDLWKGSFDVAPIETTILTAFLVMPLLSDAAKKLLTIFDGFKKLTFLTDIFQKISTVLLSLSNPMLLLIGLFAGLAVGLGVAIAKNKDLQNGFKNAAQSISENLQPALDYLSQKILPDLQSGWERIKDLLTPLGDFLSGFFTDIWVEWLNPALEYIGEELLPGLGRVLADLYEDNLVPLGKFLGDVLEPIIQIVAAAFTYLWKDVALPLGDAIGGILAKAFEGIADIFNKLLIPAAKGIIDVFQILWTKVFVPIGNFLKDKFGPVFKTVFTGIRNLITDFGQVLEGVIDFLVGSFTGDLEKTIHGFATVFTGFFNGVISGAEAMINFMINGLNNFIGKVDDVVSSIGGMLGIDISIPDIPTISLPRLQMYESGGFPDKASLFWAGEHGVPELMGTVGGKTAVAGGAEITGIREEVRYLRESNESLQNTVISLLELIAEKDTTFTVDGRELVEAYDRRKTRNGYAFS